MFQEGKENGLTVSTLGLGGACFRLVIISRDDYYLLATAFINAWESTTGIVSSFATPVQALAAAAIAKARTGRRKA